MNPIRFAFALVMLAINATFVVAQPAAKPNIESRWAELASADEGQATRAILALAATPKETIAFLQDKMKPIKADPKRVAQLVKALENSNFTIRSQAMSELENLGKYIKADLEEALKKNTDTETKMRLQQLLDKLPKDKKAEKPMPMPKFGGGGRNVAISNVNGQIRIVIDGQVIDLNNLTPPAPPPPPPGPPASWVRAVRAVNLLEHMATPEARSLLQTLAEGEVDALPTVAAREALERLKK